MVFLWDLTGLAGIILDYPGLSWTILDDRGQAFIRDYKAKYLRLSETVCEGW